jgi:zinc transporter ZupT
MREGLRSLVRAWGNGARKLGFFVLLVAGSAAVGVAIAWPLWYFATSARGLYTACVLVIAAAGLLFLVVRAVIRARKAPRDLPGAASSPLSRLLAILQVLVFLCGLYLDAVLLSHRIWVFAVPLLLLWLGLLVLLGLARRAAKAWRAGRIMPKIMKE